MVELKVGVLGASSLVGEVLLHRLRVAGTEVVAFTRTPGGASGNATEWRVLAKGVSTSPPPTPSGRETNVPFWICVAPIWVLPEHFVLLEASGARRIVALSSTSRFTKDDSSDASEQATARRLSDAEAHLQAWAERQGIEWIILRPTLIYGSRRDKNISEIARFIDRFGFFPLLGAARGLRQPIHVADVAAACVAALGTRTVANRAYNISGAETLTYRDMVARIFAALGKPARLISVPMVVFQLAVAALRLIPRYRHWSTAMAERMNQDMTFDHTEATRDFGFAPRGFEPPRLEAQTDGIS